MLRLINNNFNTFLPSANFGGGTAEICKIFRKITNKKNNRVRLSVIVTLLIYKNQQIKPKTIL